MCQRERDSGRILESLIACEQQAHVLVIVHHGHRLHPQCEANQLISISHLTTLACYCFRHTNLLLDH